MSKVMLVDEMPSEILLKCIRDLSDCENIILAYELDRIIDENLDFVMIKNIADREVKKYDLSQNNTDYIIFDEMIDRLKWFHLSDLSNIISYGRREKSTVTITSMQETETGNSIIYSLQRNIKTLKGKIIEPFEMPMQIGKIDADDALCIITCGLCFDKSIEYIKVYLESNKIGSYETILRERV